MNIRMRQLRVFKSVVESGTVSEAAQSLFLTQSSVSKTLASLEEELGFLLFDRIGRRLKLSREGRLFYAKIENAIETFEDIQLAATDIRDNQGRRLRVCAIGPMLCSLVPSALQVFSAKHSDFNFSVDLIPRIEIEEWMAQQHADLGFTLLPIETSQLNFETLETVNAVVVVPKDHELHTRTRLTPEDLADQHMILPRPAVRVRGLVEASFVESGISLRVQTQTTSAVSAVHLVASGLGISIIDPFTVTGLQSDRVVAIPFLPDIKLSYGVIWPKNRSLSDSELEFIDIAKRQTAVLIDRFYFFQ